MTPGAPAGTIDGMTTECTHGVPYDPAVCAVCKRKPPAPPKPAQETCVRGHPYEGNRRPGNKGGTYCVLCKRERAAVTRLQCDHSGSCEIWTNARGLRRCRTNDSLKSLQREAGARVARDVAKETEARLALLDGWEDLASPVEPLPAGYTDWVAEARKAAEDGPERRERVTRLHSSSEGAVGSSVKTHGSHYAVKGRKTGLVVYGR